MLTFIKNTDLYYKHPIPYKNEMSNPQSLALGVLIICQ